MKLATISILFLALSAVFASAQTKTDILSNQGCVQITNCQAVLGDGNRLWIQVSPSLANHFVGVLDNSGNFLAYCSDPLVQTGGPATWHIQCGAITVDENWHAYHTRVGTRYLVDGGTATY